MVRGQEGIERRQRIEKGLVMGMKSGAHRRIDTPEEAVDALETLYQAANTALYDAVERYLAGGPPPSKTERLAFRYPELRITYAPEGLVPTSARAFAKFSMPGSYSTTITQPSAFRRYLIEQLRPLMVEFHAHVEVGPSALEIPYPYVFERGDELGRGGANAADLALHFPFPRLSEVGDEIADGLWDYDEGLPRPLALFDAVRVDFSLRRLVHYTGTDWRTVQPWILLTNYHRYVDQFIRRGIAALRADSTYDALELPGGTRLTSQTSDEEVEAIFRASPWQKFQMPAYHLTTKYGEGVTLVNIGVGPANAKNITDHLAVLRPHAWLMVGHCGGLRQSQRIGDYVLAHAYLREDGILDSVVPTEVPIPALAEVQVAFQEAAATVTGDKGEALKRRLRTGTVVTYDDRNWELRWSQERRRINLSRAIAVDMESGTVAAQGFRFRVPYGTLLCVSDKPLHGEIKLPGAANAFYERAISEHLEIGIAALDYLRGLHGTAHSRKLRSFDEPPFR
jgi:AMP nucleosidase